eukprot:1713795-Prymnesium_polylepis.1
MFTIKAGADEFLTQNKAAMVPAGISVAMDFKPSGRNPLCSVAICLAAHPDCFIADSLRSLLTRFGFGGLRFASSWAAAAAARAPASAERRARALATQKTRGCRMPRAASMRVLSFWAVFAGIGNM